MPISLLLAAPTADGGWRPGIGDPTVGGWVTVLCYLVACWYCFRAAQYVFWESRRRRTDRRRLVLFWLVLLGSMAALGVNKQLDLQSLLTHLGRRAAYSQGWYEGRRLIQYGFVLAVGIVLLAILGWLKGLIAGQGMPARIGLLGLLSLGTFVLIRAASFHHVDRLIHVELAGLRLNWMLEIGGTLVVTWGALAEVRHRRRSVAASRGAKGHGRP